MSKVHEVSVAPVEWGAECRAVDLPFALRLRNSLEDRGAVIAHEHTQGGARIGACGVEAGFLYTWGGLYVTRADTVEKLAEDILERFGPHITFGDMVAPMAKGHVQYVSMERAGNVSVRHLIAYEILSDNLQQRWDVLVRKTNR